MDTGPPQCKCMPDAGSRFSPVSREDECITWKAGFRPDNAQATSQIDDHEDAPSRHMIKSKAHLVLGHTAVL
jgi:hypothetical protein